MKIYLDDETILFLKSKLLENPDYFEWGAGGSTFLAVQSTSGHVVSVENDEVWVQEVKRKLKDRNSHLAKSITFHEINLGETAKWGYPKSNLTLSQIEAYSKVPWVEFLKDLKTWDGKERSILVLIDGRFRKACLMNVLMSNIEAAVVLDDAVNRRHLMEFADVVGGYKKVGRSLVWEKLPNVSWKLSRESIAKIAIDPR